MKKLMNLKILKLSTMKSRKKSFCIAKIVTRKTFVDCVIKCYMLILHLKKGTLLKNLFVKNVAPI